MIEALFPRLFSPPLRAEEPPSPVATGFSRIWEGLAQATGRATDPQAQTEEPPPQEEEGPTRPEDDAPPTDLAIAQEPAPSDARLLPPATHPAAQPGAQSAVQSGATTGRKLPAAPSADPVGEMPAQRPAFHDGMPAQFLARLAQVTQRPPPPSSADTDPGGSDPKQAEAVAAALAAPLPGMPAPLSPPSGKAPDPQDLPAPTSSTDAEGAADLRSPLAGSPAPHLSRRRVPDPLPEQMHRRHAADPETAGTAAQDASSPPPPLTAGQSTVTTGEDTATRAPLPEIGQTVPPASQRVTDRAGPPPQPLPNPIGGIVPPATPDRPAVAPQPSSRPRPAEMRQPVAAITELPPEGAPAQVKRGRATPETAAPPAAPPSGPNAAAALPTHMGPSIAPAAPHQIPPPGSGGLAPGLTARDDPALPILRRVSDPLDQGVSFARIAEPAMRAGLLPATASTAQPGLDRAPQVMSQIIATISETPAGEIELQLSPEELGTVRLTLRPEGEMIRVTIQTERMETLDMIRRSAAELENALRESGFAQTQFSFDRHPPSRRHQAEHATDPPGQLPTAETAPPLHLALGGASLNLRL